MNRRTQVEPVPQSPGASLTLPRPIVYREWFMKPNRSLEFYVRWLAVLVLFLGIPARAQEPDQPSEGVNSGNYNIKQTIELGGRIIPNNDFKDSRGRRDVYNTFVNLRDGPRLFDYTLEMKSLNHQGWLFDNLYVSNFGYGGDPNNVSRVRMYKNKWYNFSGTFRRDYTNWEYNLLANPLNPNTPVANAPVGFSPIILFSPHAQGLVRRMSDYNLTFLPQSRMRLRFAYNRNVQQGPSFSSIHEGTDVLLFQNWKTTVNAYQIGVDFKLLPRTNISYDQFLQYYKGDTTWDDRSQSFSLASGTLVDLGLPFNVAASQPCGAPPIGPPFLPPPAPQGTVNPLCNAYLAYTRQGRVRTRFPTEQLTFQSNYFKALDVSGRLSYSSSDYKVFDFNETMDARITRTNQRFRVETGPVKGRRVSVSGDFGATWYVTEKFRLVDMFRFAHFRLPAQWAFNQCFFFGTSLALPATFFTATFPVPTNCTVFLPLNAVGGTPVHTASAGPDIAVGLSSLFLKQDLKNNLFELEYDFARRFGARVGYRFRHRTIFESDFESGTFVFFPDRQNSRPVPAPFGGTCPATNNRADGSCLIIPEPEGDSVATEINEHSGLLGIWARPVNGLRISFDMELLSADNAFTRISPRQWQRYKLRATYKPLNWMSFGAAVNILESRNNVTSINNLQHNRTYGFSAAFEPNERFSFDIGYDYNDIFSQILVCYVSSTAPSGLSKCPGSTVLLQQVSLYNNKAHFGYFNAMWKPFRRLTTNVGYAITSTAGNTLILNPNAPTGPLAYNFHKPYAGLAVELYKGLSWRAQWNYYGYNEKESLLPVVDFTGPRDFRGNMVTLAVRYAF